MLTNVRIVPVVISYVSTRWVPLSVNVRTDILPSPMVSTVLLSGVSAILLVVLYYYLFLYSSHSVIVSSEFELFRLHFSCFDMFDGRVAFFLILICLTVELHFLLF